jgi:hypothetical protein
MDIVIIRSVLPSCTTWRDVALTVKANLNPRRAGSHDDCVLYS